MLARYDWLAPFAEVPEDAAPPLAMSRPSLDAVGSYGADAVYWIERTQRIKLRWWQRLAITRQLEHRQDGSLCYRSVIESCPRRAGKSVRIRGLALWRLQFATDLFDAPEPQTVIHTGSDVAICREIQRGAWRWAEDEVGWTVSRANGKEAMETPGGDRWLVRAQQAVYGYNCDFAVVDEGWDVSPGTVTEGIEPAMLERQSPQMHLTSTAHRRATSLMRSSLTHAMSSDDPKVLLLLWGARPGSDPSDPKVWRAASPHWSQDRHDMIASKYEKALAGEDDPEFDDPDPIRGFEAQYLNIWHLREPRQAGEPVTTAEAWGELAAETPDREPDAIAVEDWFAEGVSVARAWRLRDGRTVVRVTGHSDVAEAVSAVVASGWATRAQILVGESIADDPAWKAEGIRVTSQKGTIRTVVSDLVRLLSERALAHDGSPILAEQVLGLRTSPGVDGVRVRSTAPAEAVKAAVWAATAARTAPAPRSPVVVL